MNDQEKTEFADWFSDYFKRVQNTKPTIFSYSPVDDNTWQFWMGDKVKPEGCTREMMWAMLDVVNKMERKEYAVEQIAWYESLWRRYLPRYKQLKELFDKDDGSESYSFLSMDYGEEWRSVQEIMKIIKQQILYFREDLTE